MGGQTCQEAKLRIATELKGLQNNPPNNWKVTSHWLSNWNQWRIEIIAEPTCPFHSIPFYLLVKFKDDYPISRPQLVLQRPELFFHPNIYEKGQMCETQLLNKKAPDMKIRDRIQTFLSVLNNPNPNSAANGQAARLCKSDFRAYYRKANKIFCGELKK